MLYQQTTEADKYLYSINGLAASTLAANVAIYKRNRAAVLGLPMQQQLPGGGYQPVQTSTLKLAERLAALGGSFGAMMQVNGEHKAFIEDQVAKAVVGLGGWDKIVQTGEWGFLLEDATREGGTPTGTITGYSLPGLVFDYGVQTPTGALFYSVTIAVDDKGVGSASFTPKSGQTDNTDPL